jgi:hypothetical protein
MTKSSFLKGHDFTGRRKTRVLCQGTTSQAAEKLIPAEIGEGSVSGHGFSRAANASKSTRALAPCGHLSEIPQQINTFFRSLFSRAENAPNQPGL